MVTFSDYQREVGALGLDQDEILRRYVSGTDELWTAIEGLSETDLDLARHPEKWTIRQYIHHIVADDNAATTCIQAAICQPGGRCSLEWYDFEDWAEAVGEARIEVKPAIEMMHAQHDYVATLVRCVPGAWDRSISFLLPTKSR